MLEDAPAEEIEEVVDFCLDVDLPVCLEDIGIIDPKPEDIMAVAEATCVPSETIHSMPFEVTADKVYAAIMGADALGRFYKGK